MSPSCWPKLELSSSLIPTDPVCLASFSPTEMHYAAEAVILQGFGQKGQGMHLLPPGPQQLSLANRVRGAGNNSGLREIRL